MTLRTFNCSIAAEMTSGPLPHGRVTFTLTHADIYQGVVVPTFIEVRLDANGQGVAQLWPNGDGTQGTQYRAIIRAANGSVGFNGLFTMPASDCNLHDVLELGPPPTVDAATAAKLAAQAAAAASSTSQTEAAGSASAAAGSATAAAGSAAAASSNAAATAADRVQTGLDAASAAASVAVSVRVDQAQSLTSPQQAQARANIGFNAATLAVALTGMSLAAATPVVATDTLVSAVGKLQAQATNFGSFYAAGRSAPVTGSKMKIDWLRESSTGYPAENEAGIWPQDTYAFAAFSKDFTAGSVPVTGGSPLTTLFAFANNSGSGSAVVAVLGDAVSRADNSTVFGANLIVRNSAGNTGSKLIGLEIDLEPSAGTTISSGSIALALNVFNIATGAPAILLGGLGGGTFQNGIIINAVTGSAFAAQSGSTAMNSLIDASQGTYNNDAIILGNAHKLRLQGTASTHAKLYNDSSNNVRLVLGSGGFFVRNSADGANVFNFNANGDFNPSLSVSLNNTKKLSLAGTAGTNSAIYNDSSDNLRVVLGAGSLAIRDSADTVSLVTFAPGGNVSLSSGDVVAANTRGVTFTGTAGTNARVYNDSSNNLRIVLGSGVLAIRNSADSSSVYSFAPGGTLSLGNLSATGSVLSTGTAGVGYAIGAGGAAVQPTSKTTGVALNKPSGQITMNAASLAAGASASFTLTNTAIAAADTVDVHRSSGGTDGAYDVFIDSVAAGSCVIRVRNNTAGALAEAVVLTFSVCKGATS